MIISKKYYDRLDTKIATLRVPEYPLKKKYTNLTEHYNAKRSF